MSENNEVFVGQPRRGVERLLSEISHLESQLALAGVEVRSYIYAAVALQEENAKLKAEHEQYRAVHPGYIAAIESELENGHGEFGRAHPRIQVDTRNLIGALKFWRKIVADMIHDTVEGYCQFCGHYVVRYTMDHDPNRQVLPHKPDCPALLAQDFV